MTETTASAHARHETIALSRVLAADPADVYLAFADVALRRRWVRMPGRTVEVAHDFRAGGGERLEAVFTHPDGREERLLSTMRYLALEPGHRLVYGYDSTVDGVVRWTALVTIELTPDGVGGTRLDWTEQVALLVASGDGSADLPHLRGAIALRLNGLAMVLSDGPSLASATPGTR
ncbi:SRPBCC domain-containing protein [Protaetiibacter mangrovi]|uniref:SRPBCC domain-containing protein n=1 Tax=Protaetiibacter mangrovi TaxID=2970926 RepID=A0ABT1ZF96_9MICO|nr:SRPBCC domain-containing protein [Protaetiibacter mangrovi]MCS0499395.1 SRPBCC domain-containing protein [Protaetiibacter mangrovi]TPX00649.1 hypothetical protein FJ656_31710 [Schumannella luteola]